MPGVDYLLCHPKRVFVHENCEVLQGNNGIWNTHELSLDVVIPVDAFVGNQDPYVYHHPWLYGYCRNANISNDTGKQSIIIFGTYNQDGTLERFFVDTVFVVGHRYEWLQYDQNYQPSQEFRNRFPYQVTDKWYMDFISPRVDHHEHPKAKFIFEAHHFGDGADSNPSALSDEFFSFIPLNFEDGIYKLIDVFPIISTHDASLFSGYRQRRNRLYRIEAFVTDIMGYLFAKSNHLVTRVNRQGSPVVFDRQLQIQYYRHVYGLSDVEIDQEIEVCCTPKCKYAPHEDDVTDME